MTPAGACKVAHFTKDAGKTSEVSAIAITGVNGQGLCTVYFYSDHADTESMVKTFELFGGAFDAMKRGSLAPSSQ